MPIHIEFLLEELSMEAFLQAWLPSFLPAGCTFETHPFQGKRDMLRKLQGRLRGYRYWLPDNHRLVIVMDCDGDDCVELKNRLERVCQVAGLQSRRSGDRGIWQVVTRIAIQELEAWYFGDWEAVRQAYPRVPHNIPGRQGFRYPDKIGGTWEAFERILKRSGYHGNGLPKVETARNVGKYIDVSRSISPSFRSLANALRDAAA